MTGIVDEFTRTFVDGWAQYLADHVDALTWHPADPYQPTDAGIGRGVFPSVCDKAVALSPYLLTRDPVYGEDEIGLQVMTRSGQGGPQRDVWALDDAISNTLLGLWSLTLPGGLHISRVTPGPSGSMGRDDNQRWLWSSNYVCLTVRPTDHRI